MPMPSEGDICTICFIIVSVAALAIVWVFCPEGSHARTTDDVPPDARCLPSRHMRDGK